MKKTPIACQLYDYVEIACMYQYPIKITMTNGREVNGTAMDTTVNEARNECIKVSSEHAELLVELSDISELSACIENPHFQTVVFS